MSLHPDQAAIIFAGLDDEEIKEISQTMSTLGAVSAEVIEKLLLEFIDQLSSTGALFGSAEVAQRLLSNILGEKKVTAIMDEIRGPAGRTIWDKLANVDASILANFLKNEYPQTAAVILAKLDPQHAAQVLAALPEAFASDVIMRILRIEAVDKEIEQDVERTLRTEFMSNLSRSNQNDPFELMAGIFNDFSSSTEQRFFEILEQRNLPAAERIRALMFTFDDLLRLDPGGVQSLLRVADKTHLTAALKGGSEEIRKLFFSNMSNRAAKILKDDISSMGAIRLSDVEKSQAAIIQATKELIERGDAILTDGNGDGNDELVY
jgi:flagellar motor switch protein FliG